MKDDACLRRSNDLAGLERGEVHVADCAGSFAQWEPPYRVFSKLLSGSVRPTVNELAGTGLEVHAAQDDVFFLVQVRSGG